MDLFALKWSEVYNITNPTLIASYITDNLKTILDLHVPLRMKKINTRQGKNNGYDV